jgi:hypothetical protein
VEEAEAGAGIRLVERLFAVDPQRMGCRHRLSSRWKMGFIDVTGKLEALMGGMRRMDGHTGLRAKFPLVYQPLR